MKYSKQSGFVLVATLWILSGLAMVAAYFTHQTELSINNAFEMKQELQSDLDITSNVQTLLYMLSTRGTNPMGLSLSADAIQLDDMGSVLLEANGDEIRIDGRLYHGLKNIDFSIQDEAGLLSVTRPYAPLFGQLLQSLEVPFSNRQIFQARLSDYSNRSGLGSLNGASVQDYLDQGWSAPTLRLLQTPQELRRILNWQELMSERQMTKLVDTTTAIEQQLINYNVLTEEVLSLMSDFDPAAVKRIMEYREHSAFFNLLTVSQVAGQLVTLGDSMNYSFAGSSFYQLKISQPDTMQTLVLGVELTPFVSWSGHSAPWRLNYSYIINKPHVGQYPISTTSSSLFKDTISSK